jgi:uridylate kinase
MIKATKVPGVYDKDPQKHADAVMFKRIGYNEALDRRLGVMDATAITLARENKVPIFVCSMFDGCIRRVVCGEDEGTMVSD